MITVDGAAYACSVVNALIEDFPELGDPDVAGIVLTAVHAHALTGDALEVIVDNPFSANWRLIRAPHDRKRVHLACWRRNRTDADSERWARLNAALDALALGPAGEPAPMSAKDYAATHSIVCAHADGDGQGSHILAPGEKCDRDKP